MFYNKICKNVDKCFENFVEYANEANRIAHSAENLYKLGTRLEL